MLSLLLAADGGSFALSWDGVRSEALPWDAEPSALRVLMGGLHSPPREVAVTEEAAPPAGGRRLTLTMLEGPPGGGTWDPATSLTVDGSGLRLGSGSGSANLTGAGPGGGVYELRYTLFQAGTWALAITTAGYPTAASPWNVSVGVGMLHASSSTVEGPALAVGGAAGDALTFTVSARDRRAYEEQAVYISSAVLPPAPEVRILRCAGGGGGGGSLAFGWLGISSPLTAAATDGAPALVAAILSHSWIAALNASVTVALAPGATALCISSGGGPPPDVWVDISGLGRMDGVSWPITGSLTLTDSASLRRAGATPARRAIHALRCTSYSIVSARLTRGGSSVSLGASPANASVGDLTASPSTLMGGAVSVRWLPTSAALVPPHTPLCKRTAPSAFTITYDAIAGDVEVALASNADLTLTPPLHHHL